MNDKLYERLGQAENGIGHALYLIGHEQRITRRDYEAIKATVAKIHYDADQVLLKAFRMMPKARVRVRGRQVKVIN